MHIKTGMTVRVIRGNQRGEEGKVLHIYPKKERAIIEGVNLIKRHTRPSQENPHGGIMRKKQHFMCPTLWLFMAVSRHG